MPTIINNSTFLDAFGAGQYTSQQYQAVAAATLSTDARVIGDVNQAITDLFQYGPTASTFSAVRSDTLVTVGLMLQRAAPQSRARQPAGRHLGAAAGGVGCVPRPGGAVGDLRRGSRHLRYGASPGAGRAGGITGPDPFAAATASGFISTAEDRTLWLTVDRDQFTALFNSVLFEISNPNPQTFTTLAWTGNLAFNDALSSTSAAAIDGVWIERSAALTNPLVTASTLVAPTLGPLGIGNGADTVAKVVATPAALAVSYNFPAADQRRHRCRGAGRDRLRQPLGVDERHNQYRQALGLAPGTGNIRNTSRAPISAAPPAASSPSTYSVIAGAVFGGTIRCTPTRRHPFNAYPQIFFDQRQSAPAALSSSSPSSPSSRPTRRSSRRSSSS